MPLNSTSTLYQGRLVDLSLFPTLTQPGVPVQMTVGFKPMAISGAGKAAQNFIRIFLMSPGENPVWPTMGGGFWATLRNGATFQSQSFLSQFNYSVNQTLEFMAQQATIDTPIDELINSVTLIDYVFNPGVAVLQCQLVSGDGYSTYPFLIPVTWNN